MRITRTIKPYTDKVIYPELSYLLTGIFFKAQDALGRFARERQYGDFTEERLKSLAIPYEREKTIPVEVDGKLIKSNRVDFVIDNKIILEFKSLPFITKAEYDQIQRYLRISSYKLGMIVNFRAKYLKPKRVVNNQI